MSDGDLLAEIGDALEQIDGLLPAERQVWHQDAVRQLSVERLWILAGNAAERYRRSADISGGVDPWSALYEFRNVLAHQTPSERRPLRSGKRVAAIFPHCLATCGQHATANDPLAPRWDGFVAASEGRYDRRVHPVVGLRRISG